MKKEKPKDTTEEKSKIFISGPRPDDPPDVAKLWSKERPGPLKFNLDDRTSGDGKRSSK